MHEKAALANFAAIQQAQFFIGFLGQAGPEPLVYMCVRKDEMKFGFSTNHKSSTNISYSKAVLYYSKNLSLFG